MSNRLDHVFLDCAHRYPKPPCGHLLLHALYTAQHEHAPRTLGQLAERHKYRGYCLITFQDAIGTAILNCVLVFDVFIVGIRPTSAGTTQEIPPDICRGTQEVRLRLLDRLAIAPGHETHQDLLDQIVDTRMALQTRVLLEAFAEVPRQRGAVLPGQDIEPIVLPGPRLFLSLLGTHPMLLLE